MEWYIQKPDEGVFGPVDLPTLQYWAAEGRIAPEDQISQDQEAWIPAPERADLHMDWFLMLNESEHYGPVHIMALRHMIESGELDPHTPIAHRSRNERHEAGTALLTLLLGHQGRLHEDLELATTRLAQLEQEKAEALLAPAEPEYDDSAPGDWKELSNRRDRLEKEVQRWKNLFEIEQQRAQEAATQYNEDMRETNREAVDATARIEKLRMDLKQADQQLAAVNRAAESGDPEAQEAVQRASMMEAYHELSRNYDTLVAQLRDKTSELQQVHSERSTVEQRADERIRHMEEQLRREQDEADQARRRLAEIEEAHLQLVRSYRDMNDRYIRLRQTQPAPASLPKAAEAPKPKPGHGDEPPPDAPPDDWQPKIRLTRP